MTQQKRLFVGGLYPGIVEQELKERFTKFGTVGGIDIKARSDDNGTPIKTFAYVDINIGEKELKQCVQTYNKTKWKGHELQLQIAKPSFLDKLKQEREQAGTEAKSEEIPSTECTKDLQERAPVRDFHMKGAVPGTAVDEEKNWVVGKYGRVLPVMKIRKKKKIMKVDPSKYCHFVKKLEKDNNKHPKSAAEEADAAIDDLTWRLEEKQYKDPNRIFSKGSALKAAKKKSTYNASSSSNKQTKLGKRTAAYSSSDSSDDDEEEEEDEPQKPHVMHHQRKLNSSQEISFEIVSPNVLKSPSLLVGGMPSLTESAVKRRANTCKASVDNNSDSPDTDDILSLTGSVQRLGVGKTESTVTYNDDKSQARLKRKKLTDKQKRTKKKKVPTATLR